MPYYVTKVEPCTLCRGTGNVKHPHSTDIECPKCDGSGAIEFRVPFEEALRYWLPKVLAEIADREQALIEAADAAAFAAEWETEDSDELPY